MGKYLQMLVDEFQENIGLFDDLQEEVESFSDSNLKKQLEEKNNQHIMEIDCLKETTLEQYQLLKQDYDTLSQQLI